MGAVSSRPPLEISLENAGLGATADLVTLNLNPSNPKDKP
jgi:hypothetical protein